MRICGLHRSTIGKMQTARDQLARAVCFSALLIRARDSSAPSSDQRLQAVGALVQLLLERQEQGVEADALGDGVALQVQQGQEGLKTDADTQDVVGDFKDVVLQGDGLAGRGGGFAW